MDGGRVKEEGVNEGEEKGKQRKSKMKEEIVYILITE